MKLTKLKLLLLALSLLILTAFAYQGIQRISTLYVQVLRVTNSGEFNGTNDFNGASTFDGASTFNGAVTLGTVTAPVVGYPSAGQRQFCATNTITDTASYTLSTHSITTPSFTWCTLGAITGDASHCASTFGQTSNITVTVKNSNATPAASAVGAVIYWCVLGTP